MNGKFQQKTPSRRQTASMQDVRPREIHAVDADRPALRSAILQTMPRFAKKRHQPAFISQFRKYSKQIGGLLCTGILTVLCSSSVFSETLEDAWAIAIRENNQLKASQQMTAAAAAGTSAARSARMPRITNATAYAVLSDEPSVDINFGQSLNGIAQANPSLGPVLGALPTSYSAPVMDQDTLVSTTQAILPLFTGGKIMSQIQQADARAEAARQGERKDLLDLKMDVAENYVLVLRMNRIMQILQETQQELKIHVQNTEKLVQQGIITENVFLAAQVSKAEIDQQIFQAQQGLDLSKSAYNRYLARPLESEVLLESIAVPPLSGPLEEQTASALENRPELRELAAQAAESMAKKTEFRSERLPSMTFAGGYTYLENEALSENNYASAAVCMVWTPFDGGVSRAKQRAADHQTAAVNRMRDEARSGIELQVRQCWLHEREARGRLEVARKSVAQAKRNLEIVRSQFQRGIAPHTDYLQAVSLKTQADVNFCTALCDAILASFQLKRAVGTI
ncbi:MAG: TolC family protein [Thermoguttaceae bacterium]|nr:TolC family protein [Thermoguttaceae bacterium]